MRRTTILLAVSLLSIGAGCEKFPGNIGFENRTDRGIWVDRVDGFERRPPVGTLKDGRADSMLGQMAFPEEITIHWSYENYKADQTSKVSLKDIGIPKGDNEFLLFEFTDKEQWKVSVDKYKYK